MAAIVYKNAIVLPQVEALQHGYEILLKQLK